jgi:mannan endo-1,4-beta-mannosidase
MKKFLLYIPLFLFAACSKTESNNNAVVDERATSMFSTFDGKLYNYMKPLQVIGANAFHSFAAGGGDMDAWNIDIAREYVGNMKENPITGWPMQVSTGSWMHSLQSVVDSNRVHKRISIIYAFGWDGTPATDFTGKQPSQTSWWNDYKIKMKAWANQFKNQPDVWLGVWNEPYRFDRADGYTDVQWMQDMNEMVSLIRNEGNNNIVLVPCAEQGQDESVLNNKGAAFLAGKKNILFDIHAYEKWLLVSNANVGARLQQLQQNKLPIFFGEVAPMNAQVLMNPKPFLDSIYNRGLSVCAWVWKYDGNDTDALLNAAGQPNDNNNNGWGTAFKTLCAKPRK